MKTNLINSSSKILFICTLFTLFALPGYGSSVENKTEINQQFILSNTGFSFNLFKEVARKNPAQNILLSPSSLSFALAMAYNGAQGDTKQAIAAAMEYPKLSEAEINNNYASFMNSLQKSNPQAELILANSIWTRKGIKFRQDFLQQNNNFYHAEIAPLESAAKINRWVNKKTKGKITNIIDKISNDAALLLINAIYFKGTWQSVFNPKLTSEDSFYLNDAKTKNLPMMTQSGNFQYYQDQTFQAISLPYRGSSLRLYIFLPDKEYKLASFIQDLNAETWKNYLSLFKESKGSITLPRFKLNYDVNLNETLKSLGMKIAFDPVKADFGAIADTENPLVINKVLQKTYMEVNETGTEAAAVTSMQFVTTAARISEEEPFEMVVNRPFFCAIADKQSDAILFIGAVMNPEATN